MLGKKWCIYENRDCVCADTWERAGVLGDDHLRNGFWGQRCVKGGLSRGSRQEQQPFLKSMRVTTWRWPLPPWRIPVKSKKPWNTFSGGQFASVFYLTRLSALVWEHSHHPSLGAGGSWILQVGHPLGPRALPQWKKRRKRICTPASILFPSPH